MKAFLFACVALTSILACHDDPLPTTPVPGNPCGEAYVVCLDMQGNADGSCCDENETCGGGKYSVGCPTNSCCDIENYDPDTMGSSRQPNSYGKVVKVKHPKLRRNPNGRFEMIRMDAP